MNASNAKDYLPLVQALAEGKQLETRFNPGNGIVWAERNEFLFNEPPENYRIKPEPRRWWFVEYSDKDLSIPFDTEAWAKEVSAGHNKARVIEVAEVLK